MTQEDIIALVIIGILSLAIIAMAITLLLGRGAWMVAGYNTMPATQKEKYNRAALCKFLGKILLPIGLTMPLIVIGGILDTMWFALGFVALTIGLIVFAAVYANTGNRFKI